MSNTLLQVGTAAMQAGMQQAGQAAAEIAAAAAEIAAVAKNNDASLNHSVVDLLQAEHQVKASAQLVKTADQMMGAMIDIFV